MSKFYCFRQNNSGGEFIGNVVINIEADSAEEANEIALDNGIYWGAESSTRKGLKD
jgi:hypothetical protein